MLKLIYLYQNLKKDTIIIIKQAYYNLCCDYNNILTLVFLLILVIILCLKLLYIL